MSSINSSSSSSSSDSSADTRSRARCCKGLKLLLVVVLILALLPSLWGLSIPPSDPLDNTDEMGNAGALAGGLVVPVPLDPLTVDGGGDDDCWFG